MHIDSAPHKSLVVGHIFDFGPHIQTLFARTDLGDDVVDRVVLQLAGDDDLGAVEPVAVVGLRHAVDVDRVVQVAHS